MAKQHSYLNTEIKWLETGDAHYPLEAIVDGEVWKLRLNDFPDQPLYTLIINGEAMFDIDDLPPTWRGS